MWLALIRAFLVFLTFFLQAEKAYNQDLYFKKAVKFVGEPMTHLESIASSAVCCCEFVISFDFYGALTDFSS